MSDHTAIVEWTRGDDPFVGQRYSRVHRWRFDGGAVVSASASPTVVPPPRSDPAAVDPEEAFVAALASCHMLWFLALAAERGLVVDDYRDEARGRLARDASGRLAITEVELRPRVAFAGRAPDVAEHEALHHAAHEACFLAASVTSAVRCRPTVVPAERP